MDLFLGPEEYSLAGFLDQHITPENLDISLIFQPFDPLAVISIYINVVAAGDSSHDGNVLENQCMPCIAWPTTQCFIFLSKLQPRSWIIVRNFVQMKMHLWSKFKVSSKSHRAVSSFAIKLAHHWWATRGQS